MDFEKAVKYSLHEMPDWGLPAEEARLYETVAGSSSVRCLLCPRQCRISEGRTGFCRVRKNLGGKLLALSYGRATHVTTEQVETEAVFHYKPNSKILSLGNFGCNLDCVYCQNWMYAQFQYTPPDQVFEYTSEQIIDMAKEQVYRIFSRLSSHIISLRNEKGLASGEASRCNQYMSKMILAFVFESGKA